MGAGAALVGKKKRDADTTIASNRAAYHNYFIEWLLIASIPIGMFANAQYTARTLQMRHGSRW